LSTGPPAYNVLVASTAKPRSSAVLLIVSG
jgi:hypothetical protein